MEFAKKRGWCANVSCMGSVGGIPSWVRGSNFFWFGSKFCRCESKCFGVGQIFFGMA